MRGATREPAGDGKGRLGEAGRGPGPAVCRGAGRAFLAVSVLALLGVAFLPAASAGSAADAEAALAYVAGQPDDEFGTGAPYFVEATLAAGRDPATWPEDRPALRRLHLHDDLHQMELLRPLYALGLAGVRNATVDGLREQVTATYQDGQFGLPSGANDDIWSILALRASGSAADDPMLLSARGHVLRLQAPDGGWSWSINGTRDVDTTGMAIEALRALNAIAEKGAIDSAVARGAEWVLQQAHPEGGFRARPNLDRNCDSTVWGIRALWAAGWVVPAHAWSYLASLRNPDGGFAYRGGEGSNTFCTVEVATVLGMALRNGKGTEGYVPKTDTHDGPGLEPAAALAVLAATVLAVRLARRRPA